MWSLEYLKDGKWKRFSEHKTGDAAKSMARKLARVDTFTGTSISQYRIISPDGTCWMTGSKKQYRGWFKIVWTFAKEEVAS